MLNISEECKELYKQDSVPKGLIVNFYNFNTKLYPSNEILPSDSLLPNSNKKPLYAFGLEDIISESMTLTEGLVDSDTISYRSCIASSLDIEITNVTDDLLEMEMEVLQTIGDFTVPLFNGVVDSAKRSGAKERRQITAYDFLYYKYDVDMISWYNSLTFPIKLYDFRIALYRALNISYFVQTLCNDEVYIQKKTDFNEGETLNGRDILKMIAEFNGAFCHVNRNNQLKFTVLDRYNYIYPSNSLLPDTIYPGAQTDAIGFEKVDWYIDCEYGDFKVQEINKLAVLKQNEVIGTYGVGSNRYDISDNILFENLSETVRNSVLENIYTNIGGLYYVPHETEILGRPYVEVGDVLNVKVGEKKAIDTYVFKRTLKGVQALRDTFSASGDEYHKKEYEVDEWTD